MNQLAIINNLILQFGEDVPITVIAQYAKDEFLIPYEEAVVLIYDTVTASL